MNYNKFNPMYEEDRLVFILHRDGLEEAVNVAKQLIKIYLKASLASRQKYRTRNYPYRHPYLESAFSARHLLRTNFLQSVDIINK